MKEGTILVDFILSNILFHQSDFVKEYVYRESFRARILGRIHPALKVLPKDYNEINEEHAMMFYNVILEPFIDDQCPDNIINSIEREGGKVYCRLVKDYALATAENKGCKFKGSILKPI